MRWALSWMLYWLGDACCWIASLFASLYQTLMNWSIIVQGDGDGAWEREDDA